MIVFWNFDAERRARCINEPSKNKMSNELLLIITLIVEYSAVVLMYKYLGRDGLYLWTVLATITANIEVLILVKAFGMEMTLGNVLFATTFLVTDIASEIYGKKDAHKAVHLGVATSIAFVVISSSWLLYSPSPSDFASPSIRQIFAHTPRLMFASLAVYAILRRITQALRLAKQILYNQNEE